MIFILVYLIIFLYLVYIIWITEPIFLKNQYTKLKKTPNVSIIISARNEQNNIEKLLDGIINQSYPNDKYEIIIANDRSTDETLSMLSDYQEKFNNFFIIDIKKTKKNWSSKKWALNECIKKASGDIILQTDADCFHKYSWIESMVNAFDNENTGFVAGPSYIGIKNNFINELLKIESLSQESFTYANSKRQLFISCTGRNIAYRKAVFNEIEGYKNISHINSGDDDLLLHKIATKTKWNIKFLANSNALVSSHVPSSIKSFYMQRLRYASKGLIYYNLSTPNEVKIILPFIYIANLMCVISIFNFIVTNSIVWLFPLLLKSIPEIILISKYMSKLKLHFKILHFIFLMILHPLYVIVLGGLAPFVSVQWK